MGHCRSPTALAFAKYLCCLARWVDVELQSQGEQNMMKRIAILTAILGVGTAGVGCGGSQHTIPRTDRVKDTRQNRSIIRTMERYRLAVEKRDSAALWNMASRRYWEDVGTPTGSDDYGYDELGKILSSRFRQSRNIRYSMRYVDIRNKCRGSGDKRECLAYVDVLIDASYTIEDERGEPRRREMRDHNQFVLEWDGGKSEWKFVSGM